MIWTKKIAFVWISLGIICLVGLFLFASQYWIKAKVVVSESSSKVSLLDGSNSSSRNVLFQAMVVNNSKYTVYIKDIQPIIADAFKSRVSIDKTVPVHKRLNPGESATINGEFTIASKGLSNQEVGNMLSFKTFDVNLGHLQGIPFW